MTPLMGGPSGDGSEMSGYELAVRIPRELPRVRRRQLMKAHSAHLTLRSHARRRHGLVVRRHGLQHCSRAAEPPDRPRPLRLHRQRQGVPERQRRLRGVPGIARRTRETPGRGCAGRSRRVRVCHRCGPRLHLAMPTPLDVDAVGGRAPLTAPAAASVTASGSPAMARAVSHAATWAPSVVGTVRREHLLVVRRVDGAGP